MTIVCCLYFLIHPAQARSGVLAKQGSLNEAHELHSRVFPGAMLDGDAPGSAHAPLHALYGAILVGLPAAVAVGLATDTDMSVTAKGDGP